MGRDVQRGYGIDTEGINIYYYEDCNFIDTTALNKPYNVEQTGRKDITQATYDKAHSDNLITEYLVTYSDVLVVVVGKLTRSRTY
jgi:hypothetical protein